MTTVFRTCSLCETMCGLAFEVEDNKIVSVRPDEDDVFSKGFVCPKGVAIADVHNDPDRLRQPMRRVGKDEFEPIGWEDAFDLVATRLKEIRGRYGADAIATYMGNPIVHNHGALLIRGAFLKSIGTKNSYSAGSQDTSPRFAASYMLFGSSLVTPVPDVDRTDYFLCIGANPFVSNGSFLAAPNMRARVRGVKERGGKVIVVDPRRSETARESTEHVSIKPGGDAAFLLAMVKVLLERGRVHRQTEELCTGWPAIRDRLRRIDVDAAARSCGVPRETIERLALEFADAPTAACYTRIGVCNNRHGTLATFAGDLLNLIAGRMGVEGGMLFANPPIDTASVAYYGKLDGYGRWRSRVKGLPETVGDLPAATLADEMETPGPGQVRALITYAGNPVLSLPNGRRVAAAIEKLDFRVAIDLYINETTRLADVIFPSAWSLTEEHVDLMFPGFAVRNIARFSPPVVEKRDDERHDWEILYELTMRMGGGPFGEKIPDTIYRALEGWVPRFDPMKVAMLALRFGAYGDRFLPGSDGLNAGKLKQAPHGIDLGPLKPGVAHRLFHKDRKIHLDAIPLLQAIDGLAEELARPPADEMLLIGRRDLRSNNSWMHNVEALVNGKERCVLFVHPDDAKRSGIEDGGRAILESRVHSGEITVRVTDEIRPGVVSLPHGWGHAASAAWQKVAGAHAGVSMNDWTDDAQTEAVVGQSILTGVPVRLRAG